MTSLVPYSEWPELEHLYLEDSYVLAIEETSNALRFRMEFVLCEGHREHRAPKPNEQYCYRLGWLTFSSTTEVTWLKRSNDRATDAAGQVDLGNIDALYGADGRFELEGTWGAVKLRAKHVEAHLDEVAA